MTLQALFDYFAAEPFLPIFYFAMVVIATFIGLIFCGDEAEKKPWTYLWSALIYMVSIPGILAILLTLYAFFIENKSLLEVNALVYFVPIILMLAVIIAISKKLSLEHVPGFEKLSGLLLVIAVTFIAIFLLQKTRIFIVFFGSFIHLVLLFVFLFILFRWGWHKMTHRK